MQTQRGGKLKQSRHSRRNPSQEQSIAPESLTDVLSNIRFPYSEKRFRALASPVSWSASPRDVATAKPGSTYLSNEGWWNRQFRCFFLEVFCYSFDPSSFQRRRVLILVSKDRRTDIPFRKMIPPGTISLTSVPELEELPSASCLRCERFAPACLAVRSVRPSHYPR